MIRIIWVVIGLNTTAFLIAIIAFFVVTNGKKVDYMEGGWTIIMGIVSLVVILLAALPLRFSNSVFAQAFSGFFALLPMAIAVGTVINNKIRDQRYKTSFAATYYSDKAHLAIANAIELNDTVLLKQLLPGKDLAIRGTKVWEQDGLNYLQFAIRIRSNSNNFPFDDNANLAAIRLLIEHGSPTTPALAEAIRYLPPEAVGWLLKAGADPNTIAYAEPILFMAMGPTSKENAMAMLLVKYGADVNSLNLEHLTPSMYLARNAQTSANWNNAWALIRFFTEEAGADTQYKNSDGVSLQGIMQDISTVATTGKVSMCDDFRIVLDHLNKTKSSTNLKQTL